MSKSIIKLFEYKMADSPIQRIKDDVERIEAWKGLYQALGKMTFEEGLKT